MVYLTQYTNRKNVRITKKFDAPNTAAIRDRIRREGAKDTVIILEGQGYFCCRCRKLVEGYNPQQLCDACVATVNLDKGIKS